MGGSDIGRVAVVATGVIGAAWATYFLACGLDVAATDPAPGAEDALRRAVEAQWPAMETMGLAPGASPDRLRFAAALEDAVAEAQFVQENGPERLDLKRDLFRRLDEAAPADTVLATSSAIPAEVLRSTPAAVAIAEHHTSPEEAGRVFAAARPRLAAYTHIVQTTRSPVPTVPLQQIEAETRPTYDGPLVLGQDLDRFVLADAGVRLQRWDAARQCYSD
jgi:hypothetical protein